MYSKPQSSNSQNAKSGINPNACGLPESIGSNASAFDLGAIFQFSSTPADTSLEVAAYVIQPNIQSLLSASNYIAAAADSVDVPARTPSAPAATAMGAISTSAAPQWVNGLQTASIAADVTTGVTDGSASYNWLKGVLTDLDATLTSSKTTLNSAQLADLKTITANLNNGMVTSAYLTGVMNAIVNGNSENVTWTGGAPTSTSLGNLTIGSTATQLSELIGKWMLGTDLPSSKVVMDGASFSVSYSASSNPLFASSGPSINDINQGYLGDCYLLSSLAEVAKRNPGLIASMFTSNGNNTYGVRFYVNGIANFVTVNNSLPNGGSEFNNGTDLWAGLAEKAYAQLQAGGVVTGNSVNYGNSWSTIGNGGAPEFALEEITGASVITDFMAGGNSWSCSVYNSSLSETGYSSGYSTAAVLNILIADLARGNDLVLTSWTNAVDGFGRTTLVADHAMSIYGYDTATGMLEIRNPWGSVSGQYWDTTFEVNVSTLLSYGDTITTDNSSTVPMDHAPVVTASSTAAIHGQSSVAVSNLFSVTDADGDSITQFAFLDLTGSGHFAINGAAQATNAEIDVTAAQLAQTTYLFGSAADTLYVRANDGTLWGSWTAFTASPFADHAPVVTAANAAAAHGQSLVASSLFSVSDVDGDTMTRYAFWDSTGNGHFSVNGVVQGTNTEIDVTAAQLATTFYVSGSGADQLYVRAFDGVLWSSWQAFTVTAPVNLEPVVTAPNAALASGHSLAASSLFTAVDPNGDTLVTYAFWDSTGKGHFTVGGASKGANTEIDVTAAQLATTAYVAGSGADQLYIRANDGTAWSSWIAFTAGPVPPVVTAPNTAIASGHSVAASSLFTASDPDGGTMVTYALWDSTGNGHLTVGGASKGANTEIDVTAAQLATTTYVAGSGTDQLYVRANDGTAWSNWQAFTAGPVPPVVTAPNAAVASGHSVAASSLFTASDPDGGTLVTYAVWDSTGSGHFTVGGASKGANTEIDVTVAQLATTTYVAGTATDQLYVRVNDGTAWSSWQPFTAGPMPPVVTASNLTTVTGQSFAASSLFTASDPDGGTITTYAFYDATGYGHFAANGVTQASNTEIDLTAAQLATTTYIAGNGTDQLYVRANDGTAWSSWQAFTATGETPAIINAGATLELANAYSSQVTFFGSTGTLKLDNPASFSGTVAGMTAQDTIDFAGINFATIQTPTLSGTSAGGTLHVTDGTHSANVALLGNYLASTFVASSDGHGGTSIVDPPAATNQNSPLAIPFGAA